VALGGGTTSLGALSLFGVVELLGALAHLRGAATLLGPWRTYAARLPSHP
jgi:hypothetical protein